MMFVPFLLPLARRADQPCDAGHPPRPLPSVADWSHFMDSRVPRRDLLCRFAHASRVVRRGRASRWLASAIGAFLLTGLAAVPAVAAPGGDSKRTVLQFESRLRDEEQKPVSGLFHMEFALKKPKQRRAFWTEKHWVAVDNGRYALQLGKNSRLPKAFDPKTALIVVRVVDVGTILEEPLAGADAALAQVDESAAGGKRIVQYAEKAGFAYDAEHAAAADRFGTWTAKKLQETIDELEKRKVKVKVGKNRINLTSVGGSGGTPFELICPAGTVAVGVRGGAGIYIDNFQVVCAPLE